MNNHYLVVDCRGQSLRALQVGQGVARVSLLGFEWCSAVNVLDAGARACGFSCGEHWTSGGFGVFEFKFIGAGRKNRRAGYVLIARAVGGRMTEYLNGDASLWKGAGYAE
jgi:hypothetical protein